MRTRVVCFRCSDDSYDRLVARSKRKHLSLARYLREWVEKDIYRPSKVTALMLGTSDKG